MTQQARLALAESAIEAGRDSEAFINDVRDFMQRHDGHDVLSHLGRGAGDEEGTDIDGGAGEEADHPSPESLRDDAAWNSARLAALTR